VSIGHNLKFDSSPQFILELTINNNSDYEGTFYCYGATSRVDHSIYSFFDIAQFGLGYTEFEPVSGYFDFVTFVDTNTVQGNIRAGIITLSPQESYTARFRTVNPLSTQGYWDIVFVVGGYDLKNDRVISFGGTAIEDNYINIYYYSYF
jgi:hypothetical protein